MISGLVAVLKWVDAGLLAAGKAVELAELVNSRGADLTDAELAELGVQRDATHADVAAAIDRARRRMED
jgi:hypothetical protein